MDDDDHLRNLVVGAMAHEFGCTTSEIMWPSRGKAHIALARQVAFYLLHTGFGWRYERIGEAFERDRTSVSHGVKAIEDRRDEPDFDRLVGFWENHFRSMKMRQADDGDPLIRYFTWAHLPKNLQRVSKPFAELAERVVATVPRSAERTVALRKLLESKDAAIRAALD